MELIEGSVRNSNDIVEFLVKFKFCRLSYDDKLFVKDLGIPRPDLSKIIVNQGKPPRGFVNAWYEKCSWLTGSKTLKKLFCWPCLLFSSSVGEEVWSKRGYDNLKNLSRSIERHTKSKDHISCNCKLHLLGKQNNIENVINSAYRREIEKFNDSVRKNRDILKRLIDICIFLCNQDLAFRGHDESLDSLNKGNFKELVLLVTKTDDNLKDFFDTNSVFSGTSKTIQNELVDSIAHTLMQIIDSEIHNAPFFAWQVDETTDITCQSQLSVIFRYVKNGAVVERFMGFYDVSSGRTAEDLFKLLTETFSKFDMEKKLIAQTYDGAAVMAGHLNGLQAKIKSVAPQAMFTHCYAHSLNLVLSNACSSIPQVRIFFANLSGFSAYFSKSTKRTNVLDTICGNRLPTTAPTRWNFTSRVVSTVYTHKTQLINVFEHIIHNPDFDKLSIRESSGLKHHLEDSTFIFYLEIFNLIFQQTDVIFSILQNKFTDIVYSRDRLQALLLKLEDFRNNDEYFNRIFENISLKQSETKRRKMSDIADPRLRYKQIFNEILDTVITQIKTRFSEIGKLNFFDLLKVNNFEIYAKTFPQELLEGLLKQYTFFDSVQLKNELSVSYCDKILGESKTPSQMLKYITDSDLHLCMPELYKLICLIVTIPVTSASVERSFSGLKRIKTYIRNTIGQDRLSNMSIVSINKDLLVELKNSEVFYEQIIDYFADKKNRRIPLIYKRI